MPEYEAKAWITVDAEDEVDAERKAGEFVDSIKVDGLSVLSISLEGEGAVYATDSNLEEGETP